MQFRFSAVAAAFVLALGVAACGSDDDGESDAGSSNGGAATAAAEPTEVPLTQIPESGCGSVTLDPPEDPDGVVAGFSEEAQEQFAGYSEPVLASAWADWKPQGEPPYTVGIQWSALNTDFQVEQTEAMRKRLEESPLVDEVIFQSTKDSIDVPAQIQQYNALLRKKPDIVIAQPVAATAFEPLVERAAQQGIPTVVGIQHINSPHAVNVQPNAYRMAAIGASGLVRMMEGKGNLLVAHAVEGSAAEVDGMAALEAVLANCPDIEVTADVTGNFVDAIAKAETLKLLATHPESIDGIFDINSMATGVMQAFDQQGRPIPPVWMRGVDRGGVGHWLQNKGELKAFGTGISNEGFGTANADTALRMLAGQGVTVNTITYEVPLITDDNLEDWAESGWDLNTQGSVSGPPEWLPQEYQDQFYNDPSVPLE